MSVRVRFAPSPTGFLHIGGARTALFNWLFARHTGGTFVLRIEDTDAARNSQEAVDVILTGLKWLGLDWDEGPGTSAAGGPCHGEFGPYFQSQRKEIYRRRIEELKTKNLAYEVDGALRFRMPCEAIMVADLVVGNVTRELTDREQLEPDFVIVRSDGQPVFHLVNVIDDLEMKITHVIRGEDHLSNTPKHIALFRAFGAEPPKYAHIPLILNSDGSKMSKRDRGASLAAYMKEGFVPEAVVNYLCLLGWSPKGNREVISRNEVVQLFDLPQILRHNARFDMAKLEWLNAEYIRSMPAEQFFPRAVEELKRAGVPLEKFPPEYVRAAILTCKEKVKQLTALPAVAGFYFVDDVPLQTEEVKKELNREVQPRLEIVRAAFSNTPSFDAKTLELTLKQVAAEQGSKIGLFVHPVRLACTGSGIGPSLYHLLEVLGRERVLKRLERAGSLCA